ncbi:hypothetical protein DICPUDRAFT_90978 [Dictyostelium purpureum]|uniref:Uncharacterized protein n=1 Tax=Dictyostelium purpureum TaxID=5786 RepID=F1A661_DICPU|nr:uncharacterized protein DICPUDRAFT_90978 [Dictyostelium purpureum]EGC28317.1 hypothetical protein DICPUDRAFT_90978 [Dictyostelium purpureum]|eukprot:XP_003295155.1 hypothetical protein DICPUDRAFT_90978 [Dictyostelium purpureum]
METATSGTEIVNEQLNNLDINKKEEEEVDTTDNKEENVSTTEETKLSKGQKKRLKEKEKKLRQKQEQESGVSSTPAVVAKPEPPKPETAEEKFNRQIEWAIYQLVLGQQRKDTTKEQFKESETIINKLKSDKIHDARKIQIMHSVFGKNLDKVMKQYPLPKKPVVQAATKPESSPSPASSAESTTTTA